MHPNSISCTCLMCGTAFLKKRSAVERGGGKYCSHACLSESKRHSVGDIWPLIDQSGGPDACWPWLGRKDPDGYGRMFIDGAGWIIPRLVYTLTHDDLAEKAIVRHTCDNPSCCNPAHLLSGSKADNMFDRRDRNRYALGESHPNAKLTEADVREIRRLRAAGTTMSAIAAEIGVSQATIGFVLSGRNWSHVKS